MGSEKIKKTHLSKDAYVYVRQSSPYQVEHNLESQRLQYELVNKAKEFGFQNVIVIDADLGISAQGYSDRLGFKKLIAEVSQNRAGMILGSETARLARNGRDWHQLLELCSLFGTLIAEKDSVYDPADPNDYGILAMKGTMSEIEIEIMKRRMLDGAKNKARRGELIYRVAVGYVKTNDNRIEKEPNDRVQQVIDHLFAKFRETHSARQTFLWFIQEQIAFPSIEYGRLGKELVWKTPVYGTVWRVLKNPVYAGAYGHGMRETRKHLEGDRIKKTKGHVLAMEDWDILIKGHHPGYISWAEFEENQSILRENAKKHGESSRGPISKGLGLLAGLLRCQRCGRKLGVTYGGKDGKVPRYACSTARLLNGKRDCITFGGFRVDQAIGLEVLRVVEPVAINAALQAIDDLSKHVEEKKRLLRLELEDARYEERRAYKQYNCIEPENRLVGRQLESKWNACLEHVEEIDSRLHELDKTIRPISDGTKQEILGLAQELPRLWNAESTTPQMRKRIIRTVIEEIIVDIDDERSMIVLQVHWMGGVHTNLEVRRNKTGEHNRSTDKSVVEIVAQLAKQLPDRSIAPILNKLRLKTGAGNNWTRDRVRVLRNYNDIPAYQPNGSQQLLTLAQAADNLGICSQSVQDLIKCELISAKQVVPYAPWAIPIQELDKQEVEEAVTRIKNGVNRRKGASQSEDQTELFQ